MLDLSVLSHGANKMRIGKVMRLPLSLLPKESVVPILQGPLRGKRWIVGSCIHACWLGCYESAEAAWISRTVRKGSVVFDIGAQAGYHTLLASSLVGPQGKVFAFEPSPDNARNLRRHINLNGARNVAVVEAAVSNCSGYLQFDRGINAVSGHLSQEGDLRVRCLSLDNEIELGNLPTPDFIKLDVEGAEASVLRGAERLLTQRHPVLLVETHQWIESHATSHNDCLKVLHEYGYEVMRTNALNSQYHICAAAARTH